MINDKPHGENLSIYHHKMKGTVNLWVNKHHVARLLSLGKNIKSIRTAKIHLSCKPKIKKCYELIF